MITFQRISLLIKDRVPFKCQGHFIACFIIDFVVVVLWGFWGVFFCCCFLCVFCLFVLFCFVLFWGCFLLLFFGVFFFFFFFGFVLFCVGGRFNIILEESCRAYCQGQSVCSIVIYFSFVGLRKEVVVREREEWGRGILHECVWV